MKPLQESQRVIDGFEQVLQVVNYVPMSFLLDLVDEAVHRLNVGWSQADVARAMRAHALGRLPDQPSLLRQWKRREAGGVTPSPDFYQPIIAETFGTVTHAMFPEPSRRLVHGAVSTGFAISGEDSSVDAQVPGVDTAVPQEETAP